MGRNTKSKFEGKKFVQIRFDLDECTEFNRSRVNWIGKKGKSYHQIISSESPYKKQPSSLSIDSHLNYDLKRGRIKIKRKKYIRKKKKTLVVSFSGGRTSAYMTKRLLEEEKTNYKDIIVIFANTGQEHEKTLEFINNCDKSFGFNTVWIESITHKDERRGSTAKVVNFETASRTGDPFEGVISKYGIPWSKAGHCTRELKENPIKNYLKDIGISIEDRIMAIGIREDESHRVSNAAEENNMYYPLVDWKIDKEDVLDWWEEQAFDLEIPEHFGNCTWCWKKSYKKLITVMIENPEVFDFPEKMEKKYGKTGKIAEKMLNNGVLKNQKSMKFFRGFRTVQDIRDMAKDGFEKFIDLHHLHITDGCSESCEPFLDKPKIKNEIPTHKIPEQQQNRKIDKI